jgi:hypothetical protein
LKILDTVANETPASFATSVIVTFFLPIRTDSHFLLVYRPSKHFSLLYY